MRVIRIMIALGFAGALAFAASGKSTALDDDTQRWWSLTSELSGDAMDGRDTGSPGYNRAAALVAKRFAEAGLKPAGVNGNYFQPIVFDDLRLDSAASKMLLGKRRLQFNHDVTIAPSNSTPRRMSARATFRGYCGPDDLGDVRGKLVVCYGRPAPARLAGFDRAKALQIAEAAGMLLIAAPGLPGEPIRWPFAYSRTVTFAGQIAPPQKPFLIGTLNPDALVGVIPNARKLLATGAAGGELAAADIGQSSAELQIDRTTTRSANVLALLPGTDPTLADQAIVLSAHLDGYGRGEAVGGDRIYNGALDNAAYVALLERLAIVRAGRGFRRPVLFAAFTGEEKGLLGSTWYVAHPTVPLSAISAIINLDQIRPLYPLKLMTVHGLKESDLGGFVRQVASAQGIAVQEDPEPERNLLRRSDNWPFMNAGIPGTSFVFATTDDASRMRYRDWYQHRYHHPADDLTTPIDWQAANDFNRFFYALVQVVADAPERVAWKPGGQPKPN